MQLWQATSLGFTAQSSW